MIYNLNISNYSDDIRANTYLKYFEWDDEKIDSFKSYGKTKLEKCLHITLIEENNLLENMFKELN